MAKFNIDDIICGEVVEFKELTIYPIHDIINLSN